MKISLKDNALKLEVVVYDLNESIKDGYVTNNELEQNLFDCTYSLIRVVKTILYGK